MLHFDPCAGFSGKNEVQIEQISEPHLQVRRVVVII